MISRRGFLKILTLPVLLDLSLPRAGVAEKSVRVFSVREIFGVSHPRQIIDFDVMEDIDPQSTYMIGPQGTEVPYQWLRDRKVAVETDLPAGAERVWRLYGGRAPAPATRAVAVACAETYYEITNDLTGVRVPVPAGSPKSTPAPIQGIRYRDGQWTAAGPNYLLPPAQAMEVRFLERGPLKVTAEVSYRYDRPAHLHKGRGAPLEGALYPAGPGYYKSTIEVQAGQPSILIEEDTDMDVAYALDVYDGLRPDRARYRGHHSSSKETGYEAGGRQYRQWHERKAMDAFVDLDYDKPKNYRPMAVWDPWIFDSGWYWQLYDSRAHGGANLFGIFAGRPSRAVGAASSGLRVFTAPHSLDVTERAAGIQIACNRRSPDDRYFPRVRFAWGIFTGVKGEHLKDPGEVQPIARQMNLHAGSNLNKLHRYALEFPDSGRGYGALYMDSLIVKRIIAKLRQDRRGPHGGGYHGYLYQADPTIRPLIDMWTDPTGKQMQKVVGEIDRVARNLLEALVSGDGIYDFRFHYWHGGLEMMRKGVWIDSTLANDRITPEEKSRLKAAASLFAYILWDDDFVPLFPGHGLNLGTENMPVQQQGYRNFYALLLAEHPAMASGAALVEKQTMNILRRIVNESGAEIGSPHYVEASFGPTLNNLLQLRRLGRRDPFTTEERLARFAEFYMNLLTPPEVRFGGYRKLISVGDGSSESSAIYGQLATGFFAANPDLAARLMGAWHASGKPHSGFFGSTVLMIDEDAPARDPSLGNANFPGWYSVLRHGWGTERESAIWFINGDFYRDHRHHDRGSLVIYALGAPLSLDWGSMYSPQTAGGLMHSTVLPEAGAGHRWDQDSPPLSAGVTWKTSDFEAFLSFETAAYARAGFSSENGMTWTRSVTSIHPREDRPIIIIDDDVVGPDAEVGEIFSLNLMAQGKVETPAGPVSPPLRSFHHNQELPSAGKVFPLQPGMKRFGFTGQWLIDWDLYSVSARPQEAQIGNWAHGWHPNREENEFVKANGRPFEERQHILRIKGKERFKVLILPYRKGDKQNDLRLEAEGDRVVVRARDGTTTVGDTFYAYRSAGRQVLATFSQERVATDGVSIAGGPVEVILEPSRVTLTAHGGSGARRVTLPGAWKLKSSEEAAIPLAFRGEAWVLSYASGSSASVTLEKR